VSEPGLLRRRLFQVFNRYQEPGGEESWVNTLECSLGIPTCYFNSSDWTGAQAPTVWSQALRLIYNPTSLRKIREFQRRLSAEAWILHNVFPVGSAAIYREAERDRVPLIQYIHNFRPLGVSGYLTPSDLSFLSNRMQVYLKEISRGSWQNSRVKTAWLAIVLAVSQILHWFDSITAWIAVSDFMRDQFVRAGISADRIFTLRHFWKPTAELTNTADEGYYLFIGRLIELKGVLVLLDVWDQFLQEKGKAGPRLVIIGEGPLEKMTTVRAAQNQLVDFRGSVPSEIKRDLLRRMRALIAPSLCLESLGLVAYEAYDFARPVLAARAGGLAEIVLHGRTGLLHEPGDVVALHQQVMTLDEEPETRTRFGQNGREWLLENADEQKWRDRFAEIVDFAIRSKHDIRNAKRS